MTSVPLFLQPANPPMPFVGRAAEGARLASLIERGPVVVVCGFSGVGKSGLVAATLAARFPKERESTIVVDAKENHDVVAAALQALAQSGAPTPAHDAPRAQLLIEALEADALWLLVENLERLDDELRQVLALALRHCRRARILCVTREDPRTASLQPHTITVGAMSAGELRALLDELEPGLPETEAAGIVTHAKGSPWRLRQLSLGGVVDEAGPEKSLLMLAPAAVGVLRTLALVRSSVPQPVLSRAVRLPPGEAMESLARRGYVEVSGRGIRLHDAARPLVEALLDADERAARAKKLAVAIAEVGGADLGFAALGLYADAGNVDALRTLLERHGAALAAAGHAEALLDVVTRVAATGAAALEPWALALALDVGGDALTRAVVRTDHAGGSVDARTSSLRAAVAAARGELSRAHTLARAALAAAAKAGGGDAGAALRALGVLLSIAPTERDRAALVDEARRIAPASDADEVRRAALVHGARADDDGGALVRRFLALDGDEQRALAGLVARALLSAGDPRRAREVLAAAVSSPSSSPSGTASDREAQLVRAQVELALGELAAAGTSFARAAAAFTAPLEKAEARLGAIAARLAVGELRGVDAELAAVAAVLQEREAPPRLARAVDEARACLALFAGAQAQRAMPSLADARKARGRARDAGLALAALDAAVACVDAAIIAGDRTSLAVEAEQLAAASARAGSRRYALHARFAALAAQDDVDASAFVELAQAMHESPIVARRAQAILGESVALDDVDRAVLAALSRGAARPAAASVVRQAAGPEWTVDGATMRIILVDGRTVDLAHKKVLFDLLATLCANGGAATKEQLLERAWGVRDYHPLRHDNRLKVAVRKLRRLLEETLGDDPIESADDGYRLRGKVRYLRGG